MFTSNVRKDIDNVNGMVCIAEQFEAATGRLRILTDTNSHVECTPWTDRDLGNMVEALPSLLRAAELNPGMAHAHELAAIAAWEAGEHETAWDQVILAHLAGADETARVQAMAAVEPPPADLMERITAPRVVVAPLDLEEIETRAEMPFDRNPMARADESVSGVPDAVAGRERVTEAYGDLARVQGVFREAISESRLYGLVLDPTQAEYVLRIAVDELGERPPRRMGGYLELLVAGSGVSAYRRNFDLRQIEALGEVHNQVGLLIDDLEAWLRDLREKEQS